MNASEKERRIEQFEQAHREKGLPVTVQRRAVFEALLSREDHPTADQIYQEVHRQLPEISRMTVYRILSTLVSLGLTRRVFHPGSVARFDPKLDQHHHLICQKCEDMIDLEDTQIHRIAFPNVSQHGFHIEDYQIHFRGLCSRCQRASRKDAATEGAEAETRNPAHKARLKKEKS